MCMSTITESSGGGGGGGGVSVPGLPLSCNLATSNVIMWWALLSFFYRGVAKEEMKEKERVTIFT